MTLLCSVSRIDTGTENSRSGQGKLRGKLNWGKSSFQNQKNQKAFSWTPSKADAIQNCTYTILFQGFAEILAKLGFAQLVQFPIRLHLKVMSPSKLSLVTNVSINVSRLQCYFLFCPCVQEENIQVMKVIAQSPLIDGGTAVASKAEELLFKGSPTIRSSSDAW